MCIWCSIKQKLKGMLITGLSVSKQHALLLSVEGLGNIGFIYAVLQVLEPYTYIAEPFIKYVFTVLR